MFSLLRALGPRVLVSIDPEGEGGPRFWWWDGRDEDSVSVWVAGENAEGRRNCYYHVNGFPFDGAPRRARKEDVVSVRWLHVDVDARAGEDLEVEIARISSLLAEFRPEPTFVVMSGGGCNALWALDGEIDGEACERKNAWLAAQLGGDACGNRDRILRLPGTTNWPGAAKRKRGRGVSEARLVLASGSVSSPGGFGEVRAGGAVEGGDPSGEAIVAGEAVADMDDPRLARVADWVKALVVQGDSADKPFASRSEALLAACCGMLRGGADEGTVLAVITDPGFGISASVLDKGSGVGRYARRQVARALSMVGSEKDYVRGAKEPYPILEGVYENVRVALRCLGVSVWFDEFSRRCMADGEELGEDAVVRLHARIQKECGFTPKWDLFVRAVRDLCLKKGVHPVLDRLSALPAWDGVGRLDRWLIDVCGCAESGYARAAGRVFLVAAVRRVRRPGCKFDSMLVLEGPGGAGKSTLCRSLALDEGWFSDAVRLDGESRDVMEAVAGKWIVEVSEMTSVSDARSVEAVKAALSRQFDSGRMAYRRDVERRARQCVFVGTTNEEGGYLKDRTGNRRFWPVRTGDKIRFPDPGYLPQLWAEAMVVEEKWGEGALDLPPCVAGEAAEAQEERRERHPWEDYLAPFAELSDCWFPVTLVYEVLGLEPARGHSRDGRTIGWILGRMGYERDTTRVRGVKAKVWRKGGAGGLREVEAMLERNEAGKLIRFQLRFQNGDPGDIGGGEG